MQPKGQVSSQTRNTSSHYRFRRRYAPKERWHLDFFQLSDYIGPTEKLQFRCPVTSKQLRPGDAGLTFKCSATSRQLQLHEWKTRRVEPGNTDPGWLIIAPRRCSYWSSLSNGGWDSMSSIPTPTGFRDKLTQFQVSSYAILLHVRLLSMIQVSEWT